MSLQGGRKTKRLLDFQARNQLGTPRTAKSFPRGGQIFSIVWNSFKIRPAHFSCGGEIFSKGVQPPGYGPVDFHTSQKTNVFLRTLSALAKFDLVNQGVRQPVQLHTFNAQLPVFDETLGQPEFVDANSYDVVMSVFHAPVLTRSLIFL